MIDLKMSNSHLAVTWLWLYDMFYISMHRSIRQKGLFQPLILSDIAKIFTKCNKNQENELHLKIVWHEPSLCTYAKHIRNAVDSA